MADIKKVLEAFAALAHALPGSPNTVNVNLHGCSDATLSVFVANGATPFRYENEGKSIEWNTASIRIENVEITAYGEHRAIMVVDTEAVAAAVAQAEAALGDGKAA